MSEGSRWTKREMKEGRVYSWLEKKRTTMIMMGHNGIDIAEYDTQPRQHSSITVSKIERKETSYTGIECIFASIVFP